MFFQRKGAKTQRPLRKTNVFIGWFEKYISLHSQRHSGVFSMYSGSLFPKQGRVRRAHH
jgi:hypothetical protein